MEQKTVLESDRAQAPGIEKKTLTVATPEPKEEPQPDPAIDYDPEEHGSFKGYFNGLTEAQKWQFLTKGKVVEVSAEVSDTINRALEKAPEGSLISIEYLGKQSETEKPLFEVSQF